jgi:hypothetical protein
VQLLAAIKNKKKWNKIASFMEKHAVWLLVVIAIVTHIQWFNPTSTLMFGDWRNRDQSAMHDILNLSRSTWLTQEHMGTQNVQLYSFVPTFIWGIVGDYDFGVKLSLLWPIAFLSLLAPYFLAKKITDRWDVAFIASLLYGFNSYILILSTQHLPIAFVIALAPFVLLSFMRLHERPGPGSALLFALLFTLGCLQELRIMMLVAIILTIYTVLNPRLFKSPWLYASGLLIILLNVFWILPTVLGGAGESIDSIANRGVFGNALFTLSNAIALFAWRWTGDLPVVAFIPQPILLYFWILPILGLLALCVIKKLNINQQKLALFFALVLLVGLLFGKQAAAPFPQLYEWFYSHVPGFNLFREASKFFLFICVGYLGLSSIGLQYLLEHKRKWLAVIATIVALVPIGFLTWPLITSSIGTLHTNRTLPADYATFRKQILTDPSSFRTLWLPRTTSWGVFNDLHPRIDAAETAETAWKNLIPIDNDTAISPTLEMIKGPLGQKIIDDSAVRYIAVPIRDTVNDDDFYHDYGDDRQYYIDALTALPWLQRVNFGNNEIALFENKTYTPVLSGFDKLVAFPDVRNMQNAPAASTAISSKPYSFIQTDHDKTPDFADEAQDIFSGIKPQDISGDKLLLKIPYKNASVTANMDKPNIYYMATNTAVSIHAVYKNGLTINDATKFAQDRDVVIGTVALQANKNYLVLVDDQATAITRGEGQKNLGTATQQVRIVSSGTNSLPNPSFEAGPWQKDVGDCNNFDNKPNIYQDTVKDMTTNGTTALQLSSFKHTACTTSGQMAVQPGRTYLLSFDYAMEGNGSVEYRLQFDSKKNQGVVRDRVAVSTKGWQTFSKVITVPADATHVTLTLAVPPTPRAQTMTRATYDNAVFAPLHDEVAPLKTEPKYSSIQASGDTLTIEHSLSGYETNNHIPNASLEDGPWQQTVGDCNNFDTNPQISMDSSAIASDGRKSLELSAKRHAACTGPPSIGVEENSTYLLSFDYQSGDDTKAGLYVSFDDPNKTAFSERFRAKKNWQNYVKTIKVPAGATHMQMLVYSFADEFEAQNIKVRYDNFSLKEIPDLGGKYFASEHSNDNYKAPKSINYTFADTTKRIATIKGADGPFYLSFSETYHSGWQAKAGDITIDASNHFKLNSFANGWFIDTANLCKESNICTKNANGTYDFTLMIQFASQKYFFIGLLVSGGAFMTAVIATGIYLRIIRKKPKKYAR